MSPPIRFISHRAWLAEGVRLFGRDVKRWRFVCPICEHIASVADWEALNTGAGAIAYSCIGRFLPRPAKVRDAFRQDGPGPCNYAGGGLFRLNPVRVDVGEPNSPPQYRSAFEFARHAIVLRDPPYTAAPCSYVALTRAWDHPPAPSAP